MSHGKARTSLPFSESRAQARLRRHREVMRELLEFRERRADCANDARLPARKAAGRSDTGAWLAICALIALLLGVSALSLFDAYHVNQENQPGDAKLTTNFYSHEAAFDELVRMLATDNTSLGAGSTAAVDLSAMTGLDPSAARIRMYRRLLRQISVADFRYFPDSGKLMLVPDGQDNPRQPSKFYLYLPHGQPQPLLQDAGYDWHGPGIYFVTGDRRLQGSWFIHHDMTVQIIGLSY